MNGREGEPLPASVIKILEGTLRAIGSRGARRLSMSEIGEVSGVSRGTLYRYFSTKEELLEAVAEFVSINYENGVRAAAAENTDPLETLRAVLRFSAHFSEERTPERIFEIEPAFYLDFFRSHFKRHTSAVRDALARTFDHFEGILGKPIDRDGVAQAIVRMQLSTVIVPADGQWSNIWDGAPELLKRWITASAHH
ncbi:MAG: TetR/AcrR family transcriptional regulator [Alphaproteobacteria bacterium]|nr:TetR/AcrR family transcriptional regulator [Alphaproteobacteria bacterium]